MASQKENDENFGPYWTEVLPDRLWSRGCVKVRNLPPSNLLTYDAPVLDWKTCDRCGEEVADYWDTMSAEEMRAESKYGTLLCSSCVNELVEAAIQKREQEALKRLTDPDRIPLPLARCNCGFLLVDCLVARNPTCPGWDALHPRHKGSPQGEGWTLWTLRLSLPPEQMARSKKQGSLF